VTSSGNTTDRTALRWTADQLSSPPGGREQGWFSDPRHWRIRIPDIKIKPAAGTESGEFNEFDISSIEKSLQ